MSSKLTENSAVASNRYAPTVAEAIQQTRPFRSSGQEAMIALALTSEVVRWPFHEVLAVEDLTAQQFNVLRILRGAGDDGLPTLEIADRMIERTPGITRLLDRMEAKGLVQRERSPEDRRQVWCQIAAKGLRALRDLEEPIARLHDQVVKGLTKTETKTLIALLNKMRVGLG